METISKSDIQKDFNRVSLSNLIRKNGRLKYKERLSNFNNEIGSLGKEEQHQYFRAVETPTDRVVKVTDKNGKGRKMLMFGSNNYLGLANHPYVIEKVKESIDKFGIGVAGPPLLNGYSRPMAELEERICHLKGTEDALIFSSGYNANLGLVGGLCARNDVVLADEYSHASFFDGIKLLKGKCITFHHNNCADLERLLAETYIEGNLFVAVEGIYSMDGDIAPLDKIVVLCKAYNAGLFIDDAHGTGVLGERGEGALEHFGLKWSDEVIMGTFSKAFAVNGGFVTGSNELVNYLRFMARSYMFSASLPPITIAAVLAGLDVIENESWRLDRLRANISYLARELSKFGLCAEPQGGIIALSVPVYANIRKMANEFNQAGIFLNAIEFPAVPFHKQRFRISVMADHTTADLDKLIATVEEIWVKNSIPF